MNRGCAFSLVVLIVLIVGMFVTCPKEADHKAVLNSAFTAAVNEKMGLDKSTDVFGSLMKMVGRSAVGLTSDFAINNVVTVEDYYLFSVGKAKIGHRERIVSIGVFNYVFAPDKDDILEIMRSYGI